MVCWDPQNRHHLAEDGTGTIVPLPRLLQTYSWILFLSRELVLRGRFLFSCSKVNVSRIPSILSLQSERRPLGRVFRFYLYKGCRLLTIGQLCAKLTWLWF